MGQVYELLTGETLRNNRDAIKFGVYRLLNAEDFLENFPDVASYYRDNDLRRIQLSEKIADLFDQYQLYREDMIQSWKSGKAATEKSDSEPWQMWLWQQLDIPSKAILRDKIFELLGQDASKLKRTFPEIHLFGISIYTNFHLDFYKRLSEHLPVHFYLCLPSQEKDHKHSLLESFGTKARELLAQFAGMETSLPNYPFADTGTLLGRLQNSIPRNTDHTGTKKTVQETHNPDHTPTPPVQTRFIASPGIIAPPELIAPPGIIAPPGSATEAPDDNSIQVTSHFTHVREVEALYNYLLDLFEKDKETKSLKPRDVLVIAPDINKYEPFIRAVFRNAPVRLPHRISGAAKTTGDSIIASLELIVNLSEEDLTAENAMGLLEQNRIGKAYQVADTSYIRKVVNKAGIRFGRENRLETPVPGTGAGQHGVEQ